MDQWITEDNQITNTYIWTLIDDQLGLKNYWGKELLFTQCTKITGKKKKKDPYL